MIGLVWGAIWARRAQTATVLALTLLAVGAAAAAPWYVFATSEAVSARHVAAAPPAELLLRASAVRREGPTGPVDPAEVVAQIDESLGAPHLPPITGLTINSTLKLGSTTVRPVLAARDRICDFAIVEGACATAPGEVMIGLSATDRFGLQIGDTIEVAAEGQRNNATTPLRIVGRYQATDPLEGYWLGFFGSAVTDLEPFVVAAPTIAGIANTRPTTNVDLELTPEAYTPELASRILITVERLSRLGFSIRTSADVLAKRVDSDKQNLSTGVSVSAGRLILLCWFTLLLVVRQTSTSRRGDLGLVKLRGVRRRRLWPMTLGQLIAPMTVGALLGVGAGYLTARLLAGPVVDAADQAEALRMSAFAVGAVFFGAMVVAWISEGRELGSKVAELLRDVPARVGGRIAALAEAIIMLLAVVGIWQLLAVESSRTGTAAPAVVPALIALAVGLLATRAMLWLAGRIGEWGMRNGRLTLALAGIAAQRRPALRWVVTLLVIAVAGLATAIGENLRSAPVVVDRAVQEIGVDQVLTVAAPSRLALRDAVRTADPAGTEAMAVSYFPGMIGFTTGLLAVDSARLGAVVPWRPEYGPFPVAAAEVKLLPTVVNGKLSITVSEASALSPSGWSENTKRPDGEPVAGNVLGVARLTTAQGRAVNVYWGPLVPGRHTYSAEVDRCVDGCRLGSIGITTRAPDDPNREVSAGWGTRVRLHSLVQQERELISAAQFGARMSWRTAPYDEQIGPELMGESDGLALTVPPGCPGTARGRCVMEIFPAGLAAPLAIRQAGQTFFGNEIDQPQLALVGAPKVPVRATTRAEVLPRLGREGAIVDLSQLDALYGAALTGEQLQVWLAADAPESIVDALGKAGVRVLDRQTTDQSRDRYLGEAPAAIRRFELLAAALGMLLAAGALLLAASVERRGRAAELTALRRQGLRASIVRRVGLAGYGWHAAAGVIAGLAAAALVGLLPVPPPRIFTDNWQVLPIPPGGVSGLALLLTGLGAGVVAAIVAVIAARRLSGSVGRNGGQR
ncbi:hypothetical protein F4553_005538 [Allocatelliglobosispora scoriae]|uniref:ABC3 transporter permease C-terminal domain-containing protein n=1 Tax=Allocatelliglobosispora scoriae TaxID=643052 RepID=A0A841BV82_9ACTN|nr:FtsX-like permease family protein [Allocatelliglobosispora scoriae]MBB5872104.1 hypothetical protein [Allocatelliglobosispora scoriae]